MDNEVRALRVAAKITQDDLAAAMDVSRQTINAIECGRYSPSLELAMHLAAHFGTTIERIFRHDPECTLCAHRETGPTPAVPDGRLPAPQAAA